MPAAGAHPLPSRPPAAFGNGGGPAGPSYDGRPAAVVCTLAPDTLRISLAEKYVPGAIAAKLDTVPPAYYRATARPRLAAFGPVHYLAVEGEGEPGGDRFQEAVRALYSVAYTLKFTGKASGRDFKVGALEGLWWAADEAPLRAGQAPPGGWRWQLLIPGPPATTNAHVQAAKTTALAKGSAAAAVVLTTFDEGEVLQALHTGPYAAEEATFAAMLAFALGQGRRPCGRHHEIYLSDPRRVPPERMRTILRQPVEA
ncbi:MAG: GyrI-like domain-containing protein, partial [Dehalococcoidia bacterium]|nr:GyrI-like domain-containing protein [Dehalococcoidia bacterium]